MDGPPRTTNPPEVDASEGLKDQSGGHQLGHKDITRGRADYARERYSLHSQIRRHLVGDAARIAPGEYPNKIHRTAGCTWVRISFDLALIRPAERSSYHYKGLQVCGAVWSCPLCAAKIQERRRQEVLSAVVWSQSKGCGVVMVSFTFPHRVEQPLAELLKLQQRAQVFLRSSRAYKDLMKQIASAGRIRALEVTHGNNGWHPHTHELMFIDPEVTADWLRHRLAGLWFKACRKVGLFVESRDSEDDFFLYSVDVQVGDKGAAGYLAKLDDQRSWGISHELTKSSSKQGRRSGKHPFKLAAQASTSGLFLEYVHAMKGARQLVWSRGLKSAVGVSEKSDQEVAQEETAKVDDRIGLSVGQWEWVKGNDARWELTDAAAKGGAPAVDSYLFDLGYRPTTEK